MKTGLVLEGGAMRGLFTSGVTDVWMENGITFDGAVGVSAGATFGCNFKSRQPGRAVRYNKQYCTDSRYGSFRNLLKTGDLYDSKFCYQDIPFRLDKWDASTFNHNPMEFFAVATNVRTGEAVYHKCETGTREDILWIQASASMPLVSHPVEIGGEKYLDGGISDSIPLQFLERQGYDRIVVVETQPMDYVKKPLQFTKFTRLALRKYPTLETVFENRHNAYNAQKAYVRQQEQLGRVLVIRPEAPLSVGKIEKNPERLEAVYQIGRQQAEKQLDEVKAFLHKPL